MKNMYKAALVAALGLASVSANAATYNSDLLVGFTAGDGSGTDVIYDLGKASAINNGQSWNLSSVLGSFSLSTVNWAVIGDNKTTQSLGGSGIGAVPAYTVFTTAASPISAINGTGAWSPFDTATKTIYSAFIPGTAATSATLSAGNGNSWYSQTVNGSGTQYAAIAGGNPNTIGAATVSLFEILDNNTSPTVVGSFTLDGTGNLTFSGASVSVPEPTSIAAFGGAGLLLLSLRNRFRSNKA